MPVKTAYNPGEFCWSELMTSDIGAAREFYAELFGWTGLELPIPDGGVYTMLQKAGHDVAGLFSQTQEEKTQGIGPHWNVYVSVNDVVAAAERARDLGAQILAPGFDVMDVGRMAVIADPTGAVLSLWQPKSHVGSTVFGEPGAPCWFELQTKDVDRARTFYTALFDWKTSGDADYIHWTVGGVDQGGMIQIDPAWGPVPPHWGVYFQVENLRVAVDKAKQMGAQVYVPEMAAGARGVFATLAEPQGAVFSLYQETA